MDNSMTEILNEEDLNIVPKLVGNKNYRFGSKSPQLIPTLSKAIKRKANNNQLYKSQKIQKDQDQQDNVQHRNSINNINNLRANLPNIMTSLTPMERRNYKRTSFFQKNRSTQGNKTPYVSRNYDLSMFNYDTEGVNFFENEQLNNTFQLKQLNRFKKKYYENNSDKNLSQIQYKKSKNNISIGTNNIYSRNIDNKNNYLQNNINSTAKNNNFNKMKFTLNKKNLMNTIKKPSKINIEKKNLKYKIPIDMINNYSYGKKKILNNIIEEIPRNNRKLNIKQRNHKFITSISPFRRNNKEINDYNNNIDIQNNEKEEMNINDSKSFIESTLIAFNGLVSQAQELGQILIDNKDMISSKNKNEMNSNKLKGSINNININSKINKLNQEIKDEHQTVEKLQKINSDLNDKINIFKENTQQYENKVKELVNVISQIKSNNNASNSNSNSDNFSNGFGNNNHIIRKDSNNNFMLENKPKKKKTRFGFVETIFMRDEIFAIINKKKPPQYHVSNKENLTINKTSKEPKLIVVNMNNNDDIHIHGKEKATNEEYLDAASQIANHIIIESLISIENEEE
jgi:hypothetical protein